MTGTGDQCENAARELGRGLHSLQDSYAHTLDPHEHCHKANLGDAGYVDNPDYDKGNFIDWQQFVNGEPPYWIVFRLTTDTLIRGYQNTAGWDQTEWMPRTRAWQWVRGSKRITETENTTRVWVGEFLVKTKCGCPAP
jgi:hypothetical protein